MDINLTVYDMNLFLDKYTRFMTKDIYISDDMYSKFIKQYEYLYQILDKDRFLYNDNKQYKKVMNITTNKKDLIRLHNQKYLQGALKKYQSFFNTIPLTLSQREKMIILSEEESTYIVGDKNYDSLIIGKIKYLIDYKKYLENNILILTNNDNYTNIIKEKCINNNLNISIFNIKEYGNKLLKSNKLLDDDKRYNFLINHITNNLFPNKQKFNSFYKAFSKYIYLNKDYKDFETFKDYHNYMYKRKYLSSNLTLKKFNESEITKRKSYLRTIKNEILKEKQEVDIANFLYLNSIDYTYDKEGSIFLLSNNIKIKYKKETLTENKNISNNIIYLYSSYIENKTYLEVLAYELIKRRYPLELLNDEKIYNKLKNTNIDNYFSEFIYKYLIPIIKYYEDNNNLNNININKESTYEFLLLYKEYHNYLKEQNLITEKELLKEIEKEIHSQKYKYLFLIGDIQLNTNLKTFTITNNYQETELIKENIKLLIDYKKYLYDNQITPITHTYLNKNEVTQLTKKFLKDNLEIINKSLEQNTKEIIIYEYNDDNRLHIYKNISEACSNIINNCNNCLISLKNIKDANILIGNNNFTKLDKNTLLTNNKTKIKIEEILKIDKIYDTIILPYLIKDNYHDEIFITDYLYNIKVMIYVALNKCRHNLVILCPSSQKQEITNLLGKITKLSD